MEATTKKLLTDYLYFKGKLIIWQNDFTISEACDRDYLALIKQGVDKLSKDNPVADDDILFKSLQYKEIDSKFESFVYQWLNLTKKNNILSTELGEETLKKIKDAICPFYPFCP